MFLKFRKYPFIHAVRPQLISDFNHECRVKYQHKITRLQSSHLILFMYNNFPFLPCRRPPPILIQPAPRIVCLQITSPNTGALTYMLYINNIYVYIRTTAFCTTMSMNIFTNNTYSKMSGNIIKNVIGENTLSYLMPLLGARKHADEEVSNIQISV